MKYQSYYIIFTIYNIINLYIMIYYFYARQLLHYYLPITFITLTVYYDTE